MTYCSKCGAKQQPGSSFCGDCGARIGTKQTSTSTEHKHFKQHYAHEETEQATKSRAWIWILLVIGAFAVIIAFGSTITGSIIKKINPPSPRVTYTDCNGYWSGMDYRTKVIVNVVNEGGNGYVQVKGILDQEGGDFDNSKSQVVYMTKNEVKSIEFDFDASSFRSGSCRGQAFATNQ